MDPTAGIRRLGFRKWYERELIKCHAALVTCFLCGITVAAIIEQVRFTGPLLGQIAMLAVVFSACIVGWLSWRSYITVLQRAERYGECSICPACRAYGRFTIEDSGVDTFPSEADERVAPLESAWMKVKCRKCGNGWRMPD